MKILIVEDSDIEATLLSKTLAKIFTDAIEIVRMGTSKEARDFLQTRANQLDLVFLDLGLPDSQDWQETYQSILPVADHVPVIVMTSNRSHRVIEELLIHGAEDYIVKGSQRQNAGLLKETIEFALLRHKVVHNLSREVQQKDQCVHWLMGGYSMG